MTPPRAGCSSMLTQRDRYVNMLRATIATFSAGLGGAISADLVVHAHVIDDHLGRERGGLVRVAEELAADGHVHHEVERLVEWCRPRVEVGLARLQPRRYGAGYS